MKKKKPNPLIDAEYNAGFGAYGVSLANDIYTEDVIGDHVERQNELFRHDLSDQNFMNSKKHKKNEPLYDVGLFNFDE